MIKEKKRNVARSIFIISLAIIIGMFVVSVVKTATFNRILHKDSFSGSSLFTIEDDKDKDLSVRGEARGSTWSKAFDFDNVGLT